MYHAAKQHPSSKNLFVDGISQNDGIHYPYATWNLGLATSYANMGRALEHRVNYTAFHQSEIIYLLNALYASGGHVPIHRVATTTTSSPSCQRTGPTLPRRNEVGS